MKTTLRLVLVLSLLTAACQKELFLDNISEPRFDSLTVVSAVRTFNYDIDDQFLWKSEQLYTYDETGAKTIVLFKDSSNQGIEMYTESFSYAGDKLTGFETTNRLSHYSSIDFLYATNGLLEKAVIHLLNGEDLVNHFRHASVNNNKEITMFDTGMLGGRHTYFRPQIMTYTFNNSNQLTRQLEAKTGPMKSEGNWFRDSFDHRFGYTPEGNMNRMTMEYTFVSNSINTPHIRDSMVFYRDSKSTAIYDSYQYIYKNLYWFSFSEYQNNSFANSMVHNSFYPHYIYYLRQPLKKLEYHSSVSPAAYQSQSNGIFENVYDEEGKLIKSRYPKYFANSAWGSQLIEYEYTKIRK